MAATQRYGTFYLDDLFFGIEVEKVQEVLRTQTMTPVPLAENGISGLINLRGQIVTAIDLRYLLKRAARPVETEAMNVIIKTGDDYVSLMVDDVGDVVEVSEESFEEPPSTLRGEARRLIRGAYKQEEALLLVLGVDEVLDVPVLGATIQAGGEATAASMRPQ